MKTNHYRIISLAVLVTLLLTFPFTGGKAEGPELSLDPSEGPAGIGVNFHASGFSPSQKGELQWFGDGADLTGTSINDKGNADGSFYVPGDASPGDYTVKLCAPNKGECTEYAKATFTVIGTKPEVTPTRTATQKPNISPPTSTFTPTSTSTRALLPQLPVVVTTVAPSLPFQLPQIDSRCTDLGLGSGTTSINFDSRSAGTSLSTQFISQGVLFSGGTAVVDTPPMGAHSPSLAVRSVTSDIPAPLGISFLNPVTAVGMFVGRSTPTIPGTVYAVLTAYTRSNSGGLTSLGRSRIRLPNAATPFEYCLVIQASTGQVINSITLDYTNSSGISVGETRWLDDLTWVPNGAVIPDNAPVVTITAPANGSRQTTNGVSLIARVREDVLLNYVVYSVNGGTQQYMDCRPAGSSDPTMHDCYASLTNLRIDADNTVRVEAFDRPGNRGEASTTFGWYPPAQGDIWITGIEVNQAVQTTTNSIPLIGNKVTVVRVFVQSREDVRGIWNDVSSLLTVRSGSQSFNYTPANVSARWVRRSAGITVPVIGASPTGSVRTELETGFYFILDRRDTAPGDRTLEVQIFTASNRPETDSSNNQQSLPVHFSSPLTLSIYGQTFGYYDQRYVSGQWQNYWTEQPVPWSDFEGHRVVAENMMPVTQFNIVPIPGVVQGSYTLPLTGTPPPPAFFTALGVEGARSWAHGIAPRLSSTAKIYLLAPEIGIGGLTGQRDENMIMHGANDRVAEDIGKVFVHETTHALGLWPHVVAPGHPAQGSGNPDFPYTNASIGPQVGIQITNPSALLLKFYDSTHDMHDYMSYSHPQWTSPYTYCWVMSTLGGPSCDSSTSTASLPSTDGSSRLAAPQVAETSPYLYISGWVSPDGSSGEFSPLETILSSNDLASQPAGDGFFRLVLEDRAGQVKAVYPFDIQVAEGEIPSRYEFNVIVPSDPNLARLALYQDDILLTELAATSSQPIINIISPNGGEEMSGIQAITWDGKGTAPLYSVDYSADNGLTWLPIGVSLAGTSIEVDFDNLPGSEQALLRVVISDGTGYAVDETDATFRVPTKGPQIILSTPVEGQIFTQGLPVLVRVSGYDWEDGALPDEIYAWASDRDGALGSGPWLSIQNLSAGEHTLTVTAADSQGNQTSASVHITVIAPAVEEITPFRSMPSIWFRVALIAAAAILIGLIIVVILVVSRKK